MFYHFNYIKQSRIIPNAFENWINYRKRLTEFILKSFEGESIAIFGVGESNDIDLNLIKNKFKKVALLDNDIYSMEKALNKYNLSDNKDIDIHKIDFWEISDNDYIFFEDMLREKRNCSYITEFLKELKEKILKNKTVLGKKYDIGICVGVHSQLVSTLTAILYMYRQNYSINELNQIAAELSSMNFSAAKYFDDILLNSIKNELLLGYEYTSILGEDIKYSDFFKEELKKGSLVHADRIEGAYQAELDMSERLKKQEIDLKDWKYEKWEFSKDKYYLMIFYTLIPTKNA